MLWIRLRLLPVLVCVVALQWLGCEPSYGTVNPLWVDTDRDTEMGSQGDSDTDTDTDTDTDSDGDADSDGDTNMDADSDGDADTDAEEDLSDCTEIPHEIELNPINMLILLDRSASMSLSEFNGETYETVVDRALAELVMNPDNQLVNFGLSVFPATTCQDSNGSSIPEKCPPANEMIVPIGPGTRMEIQTELSALDTCGGTPIASSLAYVRSYIESSLTQDLLDNPTFILLATDGAPNCSPDLNANTCTSTLVGEPVINSAQCLDNVTSCNAAGGLFDGFDATATDTEEVVHANVSTFVVGVGDTANEWSDVMTSIASAGSGDATDYFPVGNTTAVSEAFQEIIAEAASCSFDFDWADIPVNSDQKGCRLVKAYEVENGDRTKTEFPRSDRCDEGLAWHYPSVDEVGPTTSLDECNRIELCPELCRRLKYRELEGISFSFGCQSVVK